MHDRMKERDRMREQGGRFFGLDEDRQGYSLLALALAGGGGSEREGLRVKVGADEGLDATGT